MPTKKICGGRYTLNYSEKLGQGHFGAVYKGRDNSSGAQVAIKEQELTKTTDDKRVFREMDALLELSHPNIVKLLATDEIADGVYLVMEMCDANLSKYTDKKGGKLNEEAIKHLLNDMARGLQFVHEEGYIHRDLKPNNILLKCDNGDVFKASVEKIVAKIADFGLVVETPGPGEVASSIGYLYFLAPERRGGRKNYGPKSDIWSLGLIIYECLGGKEHRLSGGTQNTFRIPPGVSTELKNLLAGMLQEDQYRRFDINQVVMHPFLQ